MKQLCDDTALVVKAMKLCPSVEVIDDQWVKPLKQLSSEPKNVDAVTVYVEKLPHDADHDWIKSIFSSCGKVVYVSLPRYKPSRVIKGFAFVEFENESEVKQALEMFHQEKKPAEEEGEKDVERNEENVDEPTEKQGKKNKKCKQKLSESENEDGKGKRKKLKRRKEEEKNALISDSSDNSSTPTSKKRKRNINEEADDENESNIKLKKNVQVKSELSKNDGDSGAKRKREVDDENENDSASVKKAKNISETDHRDLSVDDVDKKHKKRKRKKKEKKESNVPNLKVISKVEWLRLKQEYQKLQRNAMTETKMSLKKNQMPSTQTEDSCKKPVTFPQDGTEMEISKKAELPSLPAKLEMQPGVVLKYFTEESIEKQNLHHVFSSIAPVSYVEKQEDQEMGFVRFRTKEGCQKVLEAAKNGSLETIRVEELSEKEDADYWEKLNEDRLEYLQKQKQRKKQRGTEKIADKIEAQTKKRDHIHFNE